MVQVLHVAADGVSLEKTMEILRAEGWAGEMSDEVRKTHLLVYLFIYLFIYLGLNNCLIHLIIFFLFIVIS